ILTDTLHYTRANMERLHHLLDRKMDFIARTVEARRRGDQATALRMVRSGESQALMASIRREMENMLVDEEARLNEYSANLDKYSRRTKNYAAISNGVLLIIAVTSLLDIRSNRKRIRKLFEENEEKNRMLEEQTADLQRLSHDLIQQNRELERFAYVASHDLRAPAGNIEALLRLYKEAKDKDERESLIDTMQDVSENLSTKLNDLVDGLRGKGEVNRMSETLPLQPIYDKVIKNLSVDIRKADAEVTYDFSEAPEITSPKSYIESIMQNLISNAIKYRDPSRRPEIRVRSHKQQGRTCIVVSDNGLGIDMEKHGADLFGLYKTFHNNRNSKGVGLYITRAQVLSLGGRIEVSSTPGKGSTFTVCL
ncbi:MAG TPA: ATP-binding protein, partial [Sphingobacteriaceae bacterium]